MRLMDLVADAGSKRRWLTDGLRHLEVRGAGAYAEQIKECPTRYVLADEVGRLCESLITTDAGMLDPANRLLRLPAERFWLEWNRDGPMSETAERGRQRVGCLVEASANGRSGTIHSFWAGEVSDAQAGQVYLEFDLDHLAVVRGPAAFRANHDKPEFQALLDHVVVRAEPEWAAYAASLTPAQRQLFFSACTAQIWFDLPFALTFATLLDAESYVATTRSELAKLNRSRLARGRSTLLDHIETRLWLGHRTGGQYIVGGVLRAAPRLHVVRGHLVRRRDTTFWRMTHLRGDPAKSQVTRTVAVAYR